MIRVALSLCALVFLAGCPEDDGKKPDKAAQKTVVAKPNPDYSISVHLDQQGDTIKVSLHALPQTTTQVECRLSSLKITQCEKGFVLEEPRDGSFLLGVMVTASLPTPLKYEVGFVVEKGQLRSPHIVITAHVMRTIDMKLVSGGFENHGAVSRSKPLGLEFETENYSGCPHQYWCSYSENLWSQCQLVENKLEVPPDMILRGFQKFAIRAACPEDRSRASNVVELYWYGVDDAYQPLALWSRRIGSYSHYSLQKQNDCVGKVSYQCRNDSASEFAGCLNAKKDPQPGFEIRAVCHGKDGEKIGPSVRVVP
jgi:hypothetical protein